MFAFKKKYFLIIQNIKDIDLNDIKRNSKFLIIYRNNKSNEKLSNLKKFRKKCKLKLIDFYVANNLSLAVKLKSDGVYISSTNASFQALYLKKLNYKIIGSAHNIKEINDKSKQNCEFILFSKLFKVDYDQFSPTLGLVKFNKIVNTIRNKLIPLGGIKINKLNYLKNINCYGFAIMTEIKKKPTKIFSRLF